MTGDSIAERDRGILSKSDREFLLGMKEELTEQSKRDTRYRIRNRLKNAIFDMRLLNDFLEPRDRKQVFENAVEEVPHNIVFGSPFSLMISGAYDLVDPIEHVPEHLEETLEEAIYRSVLDIDDEFLVDVDVDINVSREKPDIDILLEKYNEGMEALQEFQYLQRRDLIEYDVDTAVRYIEHMVEDGRLEQGEIQLIAGDEEPVPVPFDEDKDLETFIEDFKQAWQEVEAKREKNRDDT